MTALACLFLLKIFPITTTCCSQFHRIDSICTHQFIMKYARIVHLHVPSFHCSEVLHAVSAVLELQLQDLPILQSCLHWRRQQFAFLWSVSRNKQSHFSGIWERERERERERGVWKGWMSTGIPSGKHVWKKLGRGIPTTFFMASVSNAVSVIAVARPGIFGKHSNVNTQNPVSVIRAISSWKSNISKLHLSSKTNPFHLLISAYQVIAN